MIPFNVPPCVGDELDYVKQAIDSHKICGDGAFTKQCNAWLEERFHAQKVLLTTSGTTALDMAMLLCDIHPGDEVILPSYTFSSTATAAVLAGAKLVFVDIRPDTMNIDETKIEQAITDKTRVIIAMHYAGVACEMDTIMDIARRHDLKVVEDAAQGVMSSYKGKALAPSVISAATPSTRQRTTRWARAAHSSSTIPRTMSARRSCARRAQTAPSSSAVRWTSTHGSILATATCSELNAAYLWAQLLHADEINDNRMATWNAYHDAFRPLADAGRVELPTIPADCVHNATCST